MATVVHFWGDVRYSGISRAQMLRPCLVGAAAQHLCAAPCNFAYRDRASQGVQAPGPFMKEDVMNRLEKVLYTAKAHTTGGRAGMSRSSDGRLEVRLSRPGSPGTGTNPEQLFAAGWSACFESAMEFAARNMKITLPADHAVDAEIDLGPEGGAFSLAARLYVSLPGMERATAQRLVEAAHQVCPYSRATHGNIADPSRGGSAPRRRSKLGGCREAPVHHLRGRGPAIEAAGVSLS